MEKSVLMLGLISLLLFSGSLFPGLMPITSFATPSSPPCPELPNDGRPQPIKGANLDAHTWKVVPMTDDPSLFKVVDSAGINVADLFHSKANAEQYIVRFLCFTSSPSTPPLTETVNDTGGAPMPDDDVNDSSSNPVPSSKPVQDW